MNMGDVKTLIIGFLVGVLFMFLVGAVSRTSDSSLFGVPVPSDGLVLIKSSNGEAYIVDGKTAQIKGFGVPPVTSLKLF